MKFQLYLLVFFLFQAVFVNANAREEEFLQSLSIACQNEDVDQFFEMVSMPLTVMLPHGEMIKIRSKEEFVSNLDMIFVDEFVEVCGQFEKIFLFHFQQTSIFRFINLTNLQGDLKINVIDIGSIIRNQSNIFLNFLSSASLSTDECKLS